MPEPTGRHEFEPLAAAAIGMIVWRFRALAPILREHLESNDGELLPHPFMYDIEQWAESLVSADPETLAELLGVLVDAYDSGDDAVRGLIDASFVENLP
ncbi:MAG: DUF7674 family protein [Sporichthyaceae bacterium]